MDQFTRRIIGFSIHPDGVDGIALCYMFNKIVTRQSLPTYLSSDNDPLFEFYRWQANLRILDIKEIKSVPYALMSHPYIERLIGTVRHELLDKVLFWNERDLQNKPIHFQYYYNNQRHHWEIRGKTPQQQADHQFSNINMLSYQWKKHCLNLYELPIAA